MSWLSLPSPIVGACLLAAGCLGPDIPDLELAAQDTPFYWYQDTIRIYLRTDSTRLTVEADSAALPALSAALAAIGVTLDTAAAMFIAPARWVLMLHPGTSATAAAAAAAALRRRADVRFASNAYRLASEPAQLPGSCVLLLLNRFAVMYEPGISHDRITRFQERNGFAVARAPLGVWSPWLLRYPARSQFTPLEIVAAVYRHPFVDWADADKSGCMRPGSL